MDKEQKVRNVSLNDQVTGIMSATKLPCINTFSRLILILHYQILEHCMRCVPIYHHFVCFIKPKWKFLAFVDGCSVRLFYVFQRKEKIQKCHYYKADVFLPSKDKKYIHFMFYSKTKTNPSCVKCESVSQPTAVQQAD